MLMLVLARNGIFHRPRVCWEEKGVRGWTMFWGDDLPIGTLLQNQIFFIQPTGFSEAEEPKHKHSWKKNNSEKLSGGVNKESRRKSTVKGSSGHKPLGSINTCNFRRSMVEGEEERKERKEWTQEKNGRRTGDEWEMK
jgi:hypothetical protein